MPDFSVTVQDSRLEVCLKGDLDVDEAQALHDEVVSQLDAVGSEAVAVFDLTGLTGCSIFARSELVKLQEQLKKKLRRTAYVADVPRFRGLAMWVINLAEDPNAKSCMSSTVAEKWLSERVGRIDEIKSRTVNALVEQKGGV